MGNEQEGSNGPQPTAANMRKMIWNEELAYVAQVNYIQYVIQVSCF